MFSTARYTFISLILHGALLAAVLYRPHQSQVTIGQQEGTVSFLQFAVPARQAGAAPSRSSKQKVKTQKVLKKKSEFSAHKREENSELSPAAPGSSVSVIGKSSEAQSNDIFGNYVFKVIKQIEKQKFYPRLAKRKKHEGVVIAEFIIAKNGSLKEIINIESEYSSLKTAVRELINNQDRFPEIPSDLKKDTVRLRVPIRFELEESL